MNSLNKTKIQSNSGFRAINSGSLKCSKNIKDGDNTHDWFSLSKYNSSFDTRQRN